VGCCGERCFGLEKNFETIERIRINLKTFDRKVLQLSESFCSVKGIFKKPWLRNKASYCCTYCSIQNDFEAIQKIKIPEEQAALRVQRVKKSAAAEKARAQQQKIFPG